MKGKKWIKAVYPAAIVALIYLLVTVLRQLGIMNGYYNQVLMFAGINIMMTASLNLVNGFTGQFCIGHAGFMSLGAYGAAIVTGMLFKHTDSIFVFLLGLFAGGLAAMAAGMLIGLLGIYTILSTYFAIFPNVGH